MSKSSLPTSSPEDDDANLLSLVGGKVTQAPLIDSSDLEIAVAVGRVRSQILAAAKTEGVGVRELARRMKISASAVSRQLSSEGDMRFSTAILLARALGQRWHFTLSPCDAASESSASSVPIKPESRKMELPKSFESKGILFRAERTTPYDPRITKWIERPNKFAHLCQHLWADDLYLGIIYNISRIEDRVYATLQLAEENYYPAYKYAQWVYPLADYLHDNYNSEGLDLANSLD